MIILLAYIDSCYIDRAIIFLCMPSRFLISICRFKFLIKEDNHSNGDILLYCSLLKFLWKYSFISLVLRECSRSNHFYIGINSLTKIRPSNFKLTLHCLFLMSLLLSINILMKRRKFECLNILTKRDQK